MNTEYPKIQVGLAQMSAVWLDKGETLKKVESFIEKAAKEGCRLVAFGEALVPGYPHWLSDTHASRFENKAQKEIHAIYLNNGVCIEDGDLDGVCAKAKELKIAVYLGIMERAGNRGKHTLYASLVYINPDGEIKSVHRKLQPTYEERLAWGSGDGHGLRVHDLEGFTLGGLNCWENWMPLSRAALYAQGENLHVAVWPGSERITKDITRFIAKEGRSFVLSASGVLSKNDIPNDFPEKDKMLETKDDWYSNGGSCIADPAGNWIIEPQIEREGVFCAELDFSMVLEERQNFDAAGHYSRPDVTRLIVNRDRQAIASFEEGKKV